MMCNYTLGVIDYGSHFVWRTTTLCKNEQDLDASVSTRSHQLCAAVACLVASICCTQAGSSQQAGASAFFAETTDACTVMDTISLTPF